MNQTLVTELLKIGKYSYFDILKIIADETKNKRTYEVRSGRLYQLIKKHTRSVPK